MESTTTSSTAHTPTASTSDADTPPTTEQEETHLLTGEIVQITPTAKPTAKMSDSMDLFKNPQIAFKLLERKLVKDNVTSESDKYYVLCEILNQGELTPSVAKLILNEPNENPYNTLRDEYFRSGHPDDYQAVRLALQKQSRNDMKPSDFYDQLFALAELDGKYKENDIVIGDVEQAWIKSLPWATTVVAIHKTQGLNAAKIAADALYANGKANPNASPSVFTATASKVAPFVPQVAETGISAEQAKINKSLQEQIYNVNSKLDKIISKLDSGTGSNQRGRSTSRGNNNQRSGSTSWQEKRTIGTDGVCWYHTNYAVTRCCVTGCVKAAEFKGEYVLKPWQSKNAAGKSQ
ncbi:uncharacterized protein LOC132204971 [Neocloeon triangulifer]|uniref:uncharacterized protein LOC132204971 n=1 Tax=Neocloeon triangulifer TaxID=2078957 RepID=UPI00286EF7E0|nr:uncharacterized protein LOC132204971 [Neocloeon triangulifer]